MHKTNNKHKRHREQGSLHVILAVVVIVGLIGALGYTGYKAWSDKQQSQTSTTNATPESTAAEKDIPPADEKVADAQGYWAAKCGSGYKLYNKQAKSYGVLRYFKRAAVGTHNHCAILHKKDPQYGKSSYMGLTIMLNGKAKGSDYGNFKYYAGPVRYEHPQYGPTTTGAYGTINNALGAGTQKFSMSWTY